MLIGGIQDKTAASGPRGAAGVRVAHGYAHGQELQNQPVGQSVRTMSEVCKVAEEKATGKNWRGTKEFRQVRAEIYEAVGGQDPVDPLTASRVEEYLDFWVLRHQLQDDITARGLYVQDDRGRTTENRSVSLSIQTSRQMASIAATLGLVVGTERADGEDEL